MYIDSAFLESIPRFFTPVLLAAIGSALCERSGVFNIALEGMMLIGAFAAVVGCVVTGTWTGGLLFALIAGSLSGVCFAYFGVYRGGDDIIVSIGFNVLAVGLTAYLLRMIFDVQGQFDSPMIVPIPNVDLGFAQGLPIVGPLISSQSILVWLSIVLVFFVHFGLRKHRHGLRLRAAGENPQALRTVGISPERLRTTALVACGMLCALGGAQLFISNVTLFTEGMSAGRGWIALVIMMMCGARLLVILPVVILFGLIDAAGFRIQGLGMPQQITDVLPYLIAIVVLMIVFSRRASRGTKR